MSLAIDLAERGVLPDGIVRVGIRRLLRQRLRDERRARDGRRAELLTQLARSEIALHTDAANRQHYEVPPEFFQAVLGPYLKYSSGYFERGDESLAEGERAMLELSAERAGLADGQAILELGCGWGSMALWAAERFPAARYVAVSNSAGQRRFIEAQAEGRGITNLVVHTADINSFDASAAARAAGIESGRFDRAISIEMFEHLRNYPALFARIASWLTEGGSLFVHVFSHAELAYPFEVEGAGDWMAEHFFTGGLMPSVDLLPSLCDPLVADELWRVDGRHYARTSELWLENLDRRRAEILPILEATYGEGRAKLWFHRWRLFFLSCAELFGFDGAAEWGVSHYRFRPRSDSRSRPLPSDLLSPAPRTHG